MEICMDSVCANWIQLQAQPTNDRTSHSSLIFPPTQTDSFGYETSCRNQHPWENLAQRACSSILDGSKFNSR
ncbi:hypothetical protein L6452_41737 [Arctium lappa]|uniref:Uncharacterized protein n=1 Tax=Arctium lappa TaxID=4217 RepID=A0ACB8XPF3_ARCLA|nr:hypothetical protein L6452_41737 [Arctium lappa]